MVAMMYTSTFFVLLAMRLFSVSSNDEKSGCKDSSGGMFCATTNLNPQIGSSVLLPCNFFKKKTGNVTWTYNGDSSLVEISSNGRVKFLNPRNGRLKVFPIQTSPGNFSIRISELENNDLGCYSCMLGSECHQVELMREESKTLEYEKLLYICIAVAVLFLLTFIAYCCMHFICVWKKKAEINPTNSASAATEGVDSNSGVYENDDQSPVGAGSAKDSRTTAGDVQNPNRTEPPQSSAQIYPNLEEFQFQREESHKRQKFHIELFTRLRQASLRRHVYVNQHEIRNQQVMATHVESEQDGEYNNPIYNRSTEQLSRV
ncbi:hypothetical protein OJAV_G00126970 [Oryzias javanicus]|uniref:Ig-like domain-containing protein n=1 Tax=Oryzias javanicus TaxID=123683 RepID=A0A437CP24_ORYJA|nr:hypothetical protein OJAV_G00126970 [Oryzias javanicus]